MLKIGPHKHPPSVFHFDAPFWLHVHIQWYQDRLKNAIQGTRHNPTHPRPTMRSNSGTLDTQNAPRFGSPSFPHTAQIQTVRAQLLISYSFQVQTRRVWRSCLLHPSALMSKMLSAAKVPRPIKIYSNGTKTNKHIKTTLNHVLIAQKFKIQPCP